MKVETAPPPSGSGSSSAAYPRWVTLEWSSPGPPSRKNNTDGSTCPAANTKTLAAARTSNGQPIQVSLSLQEPAATSVVLRKFPDGGVHHNYCIIIAAHGDSLLLVVKFRQGYRDTLDYFAYNAGDAAADPSRPPSLLLLPRYDPTDPVNRQLHTNSTGILHPRQAEDEVVVAELRLRMEAVSKDTTEKTVVAELFLLRSGEWTVERPRICCGNNEEHGELLSEWKTSSVFPVRDRILCWVDNRGVLICDVLEESPWQQYVPLPSVPTACFGRTVCATAGSSTLKFINIFPRCCCGGAGASDCQRSHHAYTINTWSLNMDNGMEWVMDGMVDSTELWSLDTYKGLPRVMSMYEPYVICFSLCESYNVKCGGDRTLWLLMVDMRSKTIESVSRHPDWSAGRDLISSNVSDYLNPYPPRSSNGTSMHQSLTSEMDNQKKKTDDDGTDSLLRSPCMSTRTEPAAQASEILAAFQEIPSYGLAGDDMLKAYAILSSDNGCRVRSLLRVPMKRRKDWLLMETKADDA